MNPLANHCMIFTYCNSFIFNSFLERDHPPEALEHSSKNQIPCNNSEGSSSETSVVRLAAFNSSPESVESVQGMSGGSSELIQGSNGGLDRGIVHSNNVVSDNTNNITATTTSNSPPCSSEEKIAPNDNERMRGVKSQSNEVNYAATNISEV